MRGVNLGGWLVLERWMTPSLFECMDAKDEYSYCLGMDEAAEARLLQHRETFITEEDFRWLAEQGIGAVRLPVGWWLFGDAEPYVGTVQYLDKAFAWGEQHNIRILISLHGAPGSQNGHQHSGRLGPITWHHDEANVLATLDVIWRLARRYATSPALLGIGVLNETSGRIRRRVLKQFYRDAYALIRGECGSDTWVAFSDSFEPQRWRWTLHRTFYENIFLDTHQYQCFDPDDKDMPAREHVRHTRDDVAAALQAMRRHHGVIVGEWSAALDVRSLEGLEGSARDRALHAYLQTQMVAYDRMDAWFYWSYKTEAGGPWSFRDVQARGWLEPLPISP